MNKLILPAMVLLTAALVIALIVQQRALNRLRDENASLRQQLEQSNELATENERLSNSLAQARASFSEDQKRELLRLRGEAGLLRRQTNELARLQQENLRLRTARAVAARSSAEEQQVMEQSRAVAIAKMNDAKTIVLGMLMHAADHPEVMVTNFNQVTNYLQNPARALSGTNEFEFLYAGDFRALTNPASAIVVREREALQRPDGKWVRAYGFADGHSEIRAEPDGNFEAWEKPRLPLPPTNP